MPKISSVSSGGEGVRLPVAQGSLDMGRPSPRVSSPCDTLVNVELKVKGALQLVINRYG